MLSSPRPADHLDSTHTCLNNPENRQKTSRTDSLEPSIDEGSMEEGRKGGEVVHAIRTGGLAGESRAAGAARRPSRAPESGWQKRRGRTECVPTTSGT